MDSGLLVVLFGLMEDNVKRLFGLAIAVHQFFFDTHVDEFDFNLLDHLVN